MGLCTHPDWQNRVLVPQASILQHMSDYEQNSRHAAALAKLGMQPSASSDATALVQEETGVELDTFAPTQGMSDAECTDASMYDSDDSDLECDTEGASNVDIESDGESDIATVSCRLMLC